MADDEFEWIARIRREKEAERESQYGKDLVKAERRRQFETRCGTCWTEIAAESRRAVDALNRKQPANAKVTFEALVESIAIDAPGNGGSVRLALDRSREAVTGSTSVPGYEDKHDFRLLVLLENVVLEKTSPRALAQHVLTPLFRTLV